MTETVLFLLPAIIVFALIVAVAVAMFIMAYRNGTLQHDIRWLRAYIRINLRSMKRTITNI